MRRGLLYLFILSLACLSPVPGPSPLVAAPPITCSTRNAPRSASHTGSATPVTRLDAGRGRPHPSRPPAHRQFQRQRDPSGGPRRGGFFLTNRIIRGSGVLDARAHPLIRFESTRILGTLSDAVVEGT